MNNNSSNNDFMVSKNSSGKYGSFYTRKWFIITMLVLFTPAGIILMYKFSDWSDKSKKIIAAASIIWFIYVLVSGPETYTASKEYKVDNFEDVVVSLDYETEAKDAVYSEPYNKVVNYNISGIVLICGSDLPNSQTLYIEHKGTNQFGDSTIVEFQNKGDGEFDGDILSNFQSFTCSSNKQLRVYNDNGSITISGDAEVIEPAVKKGTRTVTLTQTYNKKTGEKSDQICKDEDKVVKCSEVLQYDKLESKIKKQEKKQQTKSVVKEEIILETSSEEDKETCKMNGKKVECKELKYYKELKKDIEGQK